MTSDREAGSHLRLVFNAKQTSEAPAANIPRKTDRQLAFPYPDASTVLLVKVDAMGREEFVRVIGQYMPRWIFDVRAVPRLDTVAASRLAAFQLFERSKATYVDIFGRLGIRSYRSADSNPAFWGSTLSELIKDSDRKGPYLILFDDEPLLRAADEVLPEIIRPVLGKAAHIARI